MVVCISVFGKHNLIMIAEAGRYGGALILAFDADSNKRMMGRLRQQ